MQLDLSEYKIILASKSPRRQELLKGLDLEFEIRLKEVEEVYPADLVPEKVPEYLSKLKADTFLDDLLDNELLITSDTIVILNNEILEKPKSENEAKSMIQKMSGKKHSVVTGVALITTTKQVIFSDTTEVTFDHLDNAEIEYYVTKYQPFDKAGAYGVQEWIGYVAIKKLVGSYYNVMGLPVHKLYKELKNF